MSYIASIDQALPAIIDALKSIPNPKIASLPSGQTEAIRKVWQAVDETKMFLAAVRRGKAIDNEPNPQLVRLWSEAALAIAYIDEDLAQRLRMKAEYWSDPTNWSSQEVIKAKIAIDAVAAETRRLLPKLKESKSFPSKMKAKTGKIGVFISHASEDKAAIAEPLADALTGIGYQVWYDKYTLKLGDSLRREIDKGLAASRFGIVILSPSFFAKEWPQRELDGLVALETGDGQKRILPVWHEVTFEDVSNFSPTLADRLGVSTSRGLDFVVTQIVQALDA
jgi:hypothetical protein